MPQDLLRRYPLFALLGPQEIDAWLAAAQDFTAATGETLFQAGTPGLHAYLVLRGQVRVVRPSDNGGEVSLGLFGPGDLFGEYALLPPHRNTATCRAAGPTRLLRLPLALADELLSAHWEVRVNLKNWFRLHALLHYLRDRPFLGFMSGPSALALLDGLRTATFSPGETVQADGLAADRWYFVEEGRLRLSSGKELHPGDCFGERALLKATRVPVVEALTEVRCSFLPRDVFDPQKEAGQEQSYQSTDGRPGQTPSFVWVAQGEASDCGLAALAMIARSRGVELPLAELRRRVRVRHEGLNFSDLRELARGAGLSCRAVRVNVDRLEEITLPAISHLADGHFVVLYAYGPSRVVIGDPAAGIVKLSTATFREQFSGNLLVFGPSIPPATG